MYDPLFMEIIAPAAAIIFLLNVLFWTTRR